MLMCSLFAGSFIHIRMEKSRITTMNMLMKIWTERYKEVRDDTRILMELEQNRKGRVATDVVDNNEGSGMDMVSFIARTKTISDDAEDSSDFEKHYHKMISSSWGIGGIIIPVVLLMSFFNYYYEQGSSSPVKLSFDV